MLKQRSHIDDTLAPKALVCVTSTILLFLSSLPAGEACSILIGDCLVTGSDGGVFLSPTSNLLSSDGVQRIDLWPTDTLLSKR